MKNKIISTILASILVWGSIFTITNAATSQLGKNIKGSDGTIYTITQENNTTVRRPYTSAGAFLSFGFNNWGNVYTATTEDLALPVGSFIPPRDGSIVCSDRGIDKGTCYLITESKRSGFTSESIFKQLGFDFKSALSGDVSFLNSSNAIDNGDQAHKAGTLVNKDGTVYYVSANALLGIPSWESLLAWGYSQQDIVPANSADRSKAISGVLPSRQAGQISPTSTPASSQPIENQSEILSFTTNTMTDGTANENYSFTFKAKGGKAPYKYELSHTTHPCCSISINQTTGVFSNNSTNTMPKSGNWDVWIKITDSNGGTAQKLFLWKVLPNYDQPFSADYTVQPNSPEGFTKLKIKLILEDETILANQTVTIDNYGSYTTDGNGEFTLNALYSAKLKIRFNGNSYTVTAPSKPVILPPPAPCSGVCA